MWLSKKFSHVSFKELPSNKITAAQNTLMNQKVAGANPADEEEMKEST